MDKPVVTICVVNYKTLDLTRLCLRSIRKYTKYPYKVLVIDNHSRDESTEYLKSLEWIEFVERTDEANDSSGGYAHAAALDMGLAMCDTEFFMAMHSDTLVHKAGWLTELMSHFEENEKMACVGGGKCEPQPLWREMLKKATDFKTFKRKLLRTPDPVGIYRYYNRTVCSIYRTEVLKNENLSFLMDREKGLTVGKKLYFELVDRGYKTVELPDRVTEKFLWHLSHATQVINEGEFNLRKRTRKKIHRLLNHIMSSPQVVEIASDTSLDQ